MRIRLYFDGFELSGYENIQVRTIQDLSKLDKFDRGELNEIIIDNVLDYIFLDKADEVLNKLSSLIKKKGGKIIIMGKDIYELSKAYTNYNIDIQELNKYIFGENSNISKKLALSVSTVSGILQNTLKLKVLKKRVNGFDYTVEAIKE